MLDPDDAGYGAGEHVGDVVGVLVGRPLSSATPSRTETSQLGPKG